MLLTSLPGGPAGRWPEGGGSDSGAQVVAAHPGDAEVLGVARDHEPDRVEFGGQGIICDVGAHEILPWPEIKRLSIVVPTMGHARFSLNRAFSTYGPMFYEHGISGGILFRVTMTSEERQLFLLREGAASWRVEFVVHELTRYLSTHDKLPEPGCTDAVGVIQGD